MTAKPSEYPIHAASFRDPSGFVFQADGIWYRQVSLPYREQYRLLKTSGLYDTLRTKDLLVAHEELNENLLAHPDWFLTLRPEQLSFISYPEEWSPAQLKDAALCTLTILRLAIGHGMILKDATPRNIQFVRGKPILIDSLSFERYDPAQPWIAYRQFCECFLNPLLLHHYRAWGVHKTGIAWPEGIPARITLGSLPPRSRLRMSVWLHVVLPARLAATAGPRPADKPLPAFSRQKLLQLTAHLESIIHRLKLHDGVDSTWNTYYEHTISSQPYLQEKEGLFREWIAALDFVTSLDLGANDGHFSRILAAKAQRVIAIDADWSCMQNLYLFARTHPLLDVVPLCVDIANPTPASGFHHQEKTSFTQRAGSDLVAALALIHHLVLSQNIPLTRIAPWLAALTHRWLIIEFIPTDDQKARELLLHKKTYPGPYDVPSFEACFGNYFHLERKAVIPGTPRVLYLLQKKPQP